MMAAPARKQRSRRRVAALNFLSNISLDGSHRDTKYAIFHKKGSIGAKSGSIVSSRKDSNATDSKENGINDENKPPSIHAAEVTATRPPDSNEVLLAENLLEQTEEKGGISVSSKRFSFSGTHTPGLPHGRRMVQRAQSFSGEKLHHKRRLFQTHSISESSQTVEELERNLQDALQLPGTRTRHRSISSSTSSVGSGPKSAPAPPIRKEVRFLSPATARKQSFDKDRVLLLSRHKSPFAIFSCVPYNKKSQQHSKSDRADSLLLKHSSAQLHGVSTSHEGLLHLGQLGGDNRLDDGQDISYSQFLVPSGSRHSRHHPALHTISESAQSSPGVLIQSSNPFLKARSFSYDPSLLMQLHCHGDKEQDSLDMAYDPNILDDPELRSGKHRTLMTFPSYMTSVIDYVKPSELKKELNEKFREKFPHILLTLSKLRSLKKDLRKIAYIKCGLDLWTVSQSYVFFEKIILKGLLNKPNRRLVAGACLLLSAKLNDVKGSELTKLIEEIEDVFKLHRKELLIFEFNVLVTLEFSLHIMDTEIYPHYQRLLYTS